jgi:ABC-2 type transport system permease protein
MRNSARNIWAIAAKELRSYFVSPVAWVMMGLFALAFGGFFYLYLVSFIRSSMQAQFGGPSGLNVNMEVIRPAIGFASTLVLFLMPMVTMRVYSEEKRSGTIELLLTSPLTDAEITFGKFLGTLGLYGALLAVTVVYVGVLFLFGNPEWQPIVAGYVGLLLFGSSFIALGLFLSSTTKNQMVAGAATFVLGLLFWIIGWFGDTAGPQWATVLNVLSITTHFDDFSKGVIDTKDVVYYLTFVAFGLFLTLKSMDTERWRG